MSPPNKAPTNEELDKNARVVADGRTYVATWYPQIGGYSAKAWLELHACGGADTPDDDGFDAHVFHDGDFPRNDEPPALVFHHCSPEQFIKLGELVQKIQSERMA